MANNNVTLNSYIGINKNFIPLNLSKFEPAVVSVDLTNITKERYDELYLFAQKINTNLESKIKNAKNKLGVITKYFYACRVMKWNESGKLLKDNTSFNFTTAEANLIIVLVADPKLAYLDLHNYCIKNNLDEEKFFNTKCGVYSKKLILMEAHALRLFSKLEKENENIKPDAENSKKNK